MRDDAKDSLRSDTISDAVRVFLTRVVAGQQLPFALKVPNTETRSAMAEAIAKKRHARFAKATERFDDLEKKQPQVNAPPCPERRTT